MTDCLKFYLLVVGLLVAAALRVYRLAEYAAGYFCNVQELFNPTNVLIPQCLLENSQSAIKYSIKNSLGINHKSFERNQFSSSVLSKN